MGDRWLGLTVITAAVFAAAAVGATLSGDGKPAWYRRRQPRWAPPLRATGPVWTVLFAVLAVATWRVWIAFGTWEFGYLAPYVGLTAITAYWPVSLFGKRHPGRATLLGVLVTATAVGLAWRYATLTPVAGLLTAVFASGAASSACVCAGLWWRDRSVDGRANAER